LGPRAILYDTCIAAASLDLVIDGTTLATNALIERKGARVALERLAAMVRCCCGSVSVAGTILLPSASRPGVQPRPTPARAQAVNPISNQAGENATSPVGSLDRHK